MRICRVKDPSWETSDATSLSHPLLPCVLSRLLRTRRAELRRASANAIPRSNISCARSAMSMRRKSAYHEANKKAAISLSAFGDKEQLLVDRARSFQLYRWCNLNIKTSRTRDANRDQRSVEISMQLPKVRFAIRIWIHEMKCENPRNFVNSILRLDNLIRFCRMCIEPMCKSNTRFFLSLIDNTWYNLA